MQDWTKITAYSEPLRRGFLYLLRERGYSAGLIARLWPFDGEPG